MLEAQPLHRVVQLDIDAQVVGVALQLDRGVKPAEALDGQRQLRAVAVDCQRPVPVAFRPRLKRDRGRAAGCSGGHNASSGAAATARASWFVAFVSLSDSNTKMRRLQAPPQAKRSDKVLAARRNEAGGKWQSRRHGEDHGTARTASGGKPRAVATMTPRSIARRVP